VVKPDISTAIFSTWTDNRTKLVGDQIPEAGGIKIDYGFDGFEFDEKRFPHLPDRKFISDIDDLVSTEAGRYIKENGPDLSWVYLEFTDDMGHKFGDSPEYFAAIQKADAQVGKVWKAIKDREKRFGEQWMIVVTTDHGRDAETGKSHGKQSDRERTTWIVTNVNTLNKRFQQSTAIVDIMPSVLSFMEIAIPVATKEELDGVSFIGEASISNLKATRKEGSVELTWDVLDPKGNVEIFLSTTNLFKEGKRDEYKSLGSAKVSGGNFKLDENLSSDFYKILVKAPCNWLNVWVLKE
jgi:predicted AlkP superfamily pyrophosphatase or phosphodiesterase